MKKVEENTIQNKIHKAESCGHTVEYVGKMEKAAFADQVINARPSAGTSAGSNLSGAMNDFTSQSKPKAVDKLKSVGSNVASKVRDVGSNVASKTRDIANKAGSNIKAANTARRNTNALDSASKMLNSGKKASGVLNKINSVGKGLGKFAAPVSAGLTAADAVSSAYNAYKDPEKQDKKQMDAWKNATPMSALSNPADTIAGGLSTGVKKIMDYADVGGDKEAQRIMAAGDKKAASKKAARAANTAWNKKGMKGRAEDISKRPPLPPTAKIGDGSTNNLSPKQRNTDVAGAQKQAANKPKRSAFGQAFDRARAAGDKEFTWKNPKTGKTGRFHTRHKGEKSNPFARQQKQKAKEQAPAKANVAPAKKESISSRTNPDNQFNKMNPAQQQNMKQAYSNADRQGKVQQKAPRETRQQEVNRLTGSGERAPLSNKKENKKMRRGFGEYKDSGYSGTFKDYQKHKNYIKDMNARIRQQNVNRMTGSGSTRIPRVKKSEENSMEKLKKFMEK